MDKIARQILKNELWLLRLAVIIPVLWAGIRGIMEPLNWVGFVPGFVADVMDPEIFLLIHGFVWIIASISILAGFMRPLFALVITGGLVGILIFHGVDDITFRDIGLAITAFILFLREVKSR